MIKTSTFLNPSLPKVPISFHLCCIFAAQARHLETIANRLTGVENFINTNPM